MYPYPYYHNTSFVGGPLLLLYPPTPLPPPSPLPLPPFLSSSLSFLRPQEKNLFYWQWVINFDTFCLTLPSPGGRALRVNLDSETRCLHMYFCKNYWGRLTWISSQRRWWLSSFRNLFQEPNLHPATSIPLWLALERERNRNASPTHPIKREREEYASSTYPITLIKMLLFNFEFWNTSIWEDFIWKEWGRTPSKSVFYLSCTLEKAPKKKKNFLSLSLSLSLSLFR